MYGMICCDVIPVGREEILLISRNMDIHIRLEECAKNYAREHSIQMSRCVAERDITHLSFTFYTIPKTRIAFKPHTLKGLIGKKSGISRFIELQELINQCGYSSYDIS